MRIRDIAAEISSALGGILFVGPKCRFKTIQDGIHAHCTRVDTPYTRTTSAQWEFISDANLDELTTLDIHVVLDVGVPVDISVGFWAEGIPLGANEAETAANTRDWLTANAGTYFTVSGAGAFVIVTKKAGVTYFDSGSPYPGVDQVVYTILTSYTDVITTWTPPSADRTVRTMPATYTEDVTDVPAHVVLLALDGPVTIDGDLTITGGRVIGDWAVTGTISGGVIEGSPGWPQSMLVQAGESTDAASDLAVAAGANIDTPFVIFMRGGAKYDYPFIPATGVHIEPIGHRLDPLPREFFPIPEGDQALGTIRCDDYRDWMILPCAALGGISPMAYLRNAGIPVTMMLNPGPAAPYPLTASKLKFLKLAMLQGPVSIGSHGYGHVEVTTTTAYKEVVEARRLLDYLSVAWEAGGAGNYVDYNAMTSTEETHAFMELLGARARGYTEPGGAWTNSHMWEKLASGLTDAVLASHEWVMTAGNWVMQSDPMPRVINCLPSLPDPDTYPTLTSPRSRWAMYFHDYSDMPGANQGAKEAEWKSRVDKLAALVAARTVRMVSIDALALGIRSGIDTIAADGYWGGAPDFRKQAVAVLPTGTFDSNAWYSQDNSGDGAIVSGPKLRIYRNKSVVSPIPVMDGRMARYRITTQAKTGRTMTLQLSVQGVLKKTTGTSPRYLVSPFEEDVITDTSTVIRKWGYHPWHWRQAQVILHATSANALDEYVDITLFEGPVAG